MQVRSEAITRAGRAGGGTDRRRQLIEATVSTIANEGLSRTTLAKVARRAGLSTGIVNFYFQSKDTLLVATLSHLAQGFDSALKQAIATHENDPEAALDAIVEMQFDPRQSSLERVAVWNAFWGETRARGEYLAICGEIDQAYADVLRSLCQAIEDSGEYQHQSVEALARGFDGVMQSLLQDLLVDGESFDRVGAIETCRAFLASVFPRHFARPVATTRESGGEDKSINRLLAPWTYFDDELLALESDTLFKRNWQLVGHVSDVPNGGDYKTFDMLGERALVIRGDDGQLRAFHNVCRHRGSRVVAADDGNCARSIVCPFHGWSYQLDGRLRGIPSADKFPEMDRATLGLIPLDIEVWRGFVFIRFDGAGVSVAELMSPLEEQLEPFRLEELQPIGGAYAEEVPVNWKSLHDIDNEGYHVAVGHPSLNSLLCDYRDEFYPHGVATSHARIGEQPSLHWSVARYQKLKTSFDHLPASHQRCWFYWSLFPNLSMAVYPESFEFYMSVPLDVERTLMVGSYYALPDERRETRAARYLNQRINREVAREDYQLVRWSYEAMRSSVFPRNRLSEIEYGVASFHHRIREAIPVAGEEKAPSSGRVQATNNALLESREMGRAT